ncbi:SpvB/TcaC N-terminal domain-containing protein [Pseudoalteromonas prydzensis]|uniref:SpvB/TcaC N-terminal domain-containing protein n=1 Tax=Pseudoalteromonas prydzensis TaxID=182141 RepID=UPI000AAFAD80|nr:SpvB/TcaC N-terminal domain-containing protein [Pseudoalteromonas prydzensis]
MKSNNKVLSRLIISLIFLFSNASFSAISILPVPNNVSVTENQGIIYITWKYDFDPGDSIYPPVDPSPLPFSLSAAKSSQNSVSTLADCGLLCGATSITLTPISGSSNSNVKFEIQKSIPNSSFFTTLEAQWSSYTYKYPYQGDGPFKFRIRAVEVDFSTGKNVYSRYVETPSLSRLNQVTISPNGGVIEPLNRISLSSIGGTVKYKLVSLNEACTDGNWATYNSSLLLSSPKRVCAKATKPGQIDSQISFSDFQVKLNSPTLYPETASLGSESLITLVSPQSTTLKYKLIPQTQSCTNSDWENYSSGFSISSDIRVCAKASKAGWVDSNIVHRDYNFYESSAFSGITSNQPSDGAFIEALEPTTSNIGTIKGQAGVSGGAATYHIPIELPPERAGMQPVVSLNYSSRSGNGIAGVGWSLSAGSNITRCAATYAQDGFTQHPQYNSNDRLCLDGQRLVVESGTYGSSGAEYRTEIDSFVRVTQSGYLNGTSTWFKAEYKNGRVAYFGKTAESRLVHGGKSAAYSWLIEYQHDATAKNYIHYEYENFGVGEKLLTEITYTGNSISSKGIQAVSFTYEGKNVPNSGYIAGGKYSSTQRLQIVTVKNSDDLVRSYSLNYATSEFSGRPLLNELTQCEKNNKCFLATNIQWAEQAPTLPIEPLGGEGNMLYQNVSSLSSVIPRGDLNGDGVRDWQGYYVNAEGEFTPNQREFDSCTYNKYTRKYECHTGDFDLDGKSDSWTIVNKSIQIQLSTGGTVNAGIPMPDSSHFGLRDSYIRSIADFNNDGWPDILIYQAGSSPRLVLYLNSKNITTPFSLAHAQFPLSTHRSGTRFSLATDYSVLGDLTGDGTIDLMKVSTGAGLRISYLQPIPSAFYLGEENYQTSHSSPFQVSTDPLEPGLSYFMDINGDGLLDWLGWEYRSGSTFLTYRINMGKLEFSPEIMLSSDLIDVKIEYIYHNENEQDIRRVPKYLDAFIVEDINGDGQAELLMPGERILEGCALIGTQRPTSRLEQRCGNALYGFYYASQNFNARSSINSTLADKSIYQFDAIYFDQQSNGNIEARKESTSYIGSAYDSAFVDAYGTGLKSFIFNHSIAEGYSFKGNASGDFAGYESQYGVYINRNYGSGSGITGSDYAASDIINSVENGLGVKSQWRLRPLSSNELDYNLLSNDIVNGNGYFNFASSMYVVSSFKQSNGLAGDSERKYNYSGAVYNAQGRGFMGFKSIIEGDVSRGLITQSDFKQVFPYQGKLTRQATFTHDDYVTRGDGLLGSAASESMALSYSNTEWRDNVNHSIAGVYSVYPRTTTQVTRDLSTKAELTRTNKNITGIDEYGNVTAASTQVADDWGTYSTSEVQVYDSNENNWWLNKLTSKTTTKASIANRHSSDPFTNAEFDKTTSLTTAYSNYHTSRQPQTVLISSQLAGSNSGYGSTVTTSYNAYGLPLSVSQTTKVRNSSGSWVDQTRTTSTTYSKNGTSEASDGYFPYKQTNAKGHISYTKVNPATGQVTQTQQQLSGSHYQVTNYRYDAYNRPYSVQTAGMPIQYTAVQEADEQAPAHAVLQVLQTAAGQPTQKIYQDKLGRTLRTAVEGFHGDWVFSDVIYNSVGDKTFESVPYKEYATRYGSTYAYDTLGRAIEKVTAQHCGDMTTDYDYAGLTTNITVNEDCYGITLAISRTYNSLKQLMQTVDANNGVTRYSYNNQGLPIIIQDANGNNIVAKYNALGQKTQVNDPNQGITNFQYNGFGELQYESRAGNKAVSYVTDVLGRVTRRTATGENTLTYTYDGATYGLGQLNQATGNDVTKTYTYDNRGRPSSQTIAGSGKSYTTTTFYDSNYGRVKGLRYPNNLTLEYIYNDAGYQTQVKNAANGYVYKAITEHDAFGNITQGTLGNGLIENTAYSTKNGQMTLKTIAKNNSNIMSIDYSAYDGFGNLKAVDITTGSIGNQHSFSESYDYDALHRLESNAINGITTIDYSYDAVGNLLSKSDYASQYDYENGTTGGPNAVKRIYRSGSWKTFAYDARGNMTKGDGLTSATYNAMDKPTQIIKSGKTLNFTYGPQHMRFKQVNGSVTTYYSDKLYEEEINGTKTTWRAYIDDIAVISQTTDEGTTIRYTHRDRLGSARVFTDHNGQVEAERNFDPFGKPRLASGDLKAYGNSKLDDLDKAKTRRGFTDHEHLDNVELIHMNGRVYDYNLGRFMSVDPVIQSPTNSQSINPYSYIMNNPLSGTDPTGYCAAATGTRIKDCGDMKVDVKMDGKTVGSTVVKDVNFKNGAEVNSAMAQGAGAIGTAMKAMDIGSQKQMATNTAAPSAGNAKGATNPTAGTLDKVLETAEGVGKAAVGSLKRGGVAGLGLAPMPTATDEEMEDLAAPVIAANISSYEQEQSAAIARVRSADGGIVLYHGTDVQSALRILNGEPLNAVIASGNKIDGLPGFYLATDYNDAEFFALRRGEGAVIKFMISNKALGGLNANGASFNKIPIGGFKADGYEFLVPPEAFGTFNSYRKAQEIVATP